MKDIEELIKHLKHLDSFVLAIDGMCGSGKSTLASLLQKEFDCLVFHMDDFYLPLEKRTEERLSRPGGNVDYERFLDTVLKPISLKQDIHYQVFNCATMTFNDIDIIPYHPKIIIEGSYSLRDELVPYYTNIVALQISPSLQIERIKQRNKKALKTFQEKWIPLENKYFDYYKIFEKYPTIQIK